MATFTHHTSWQVNRSCSGGRWHKPHFAPHWHFGGCVQWRRVAAEEAGSAARLYARKFAGRVHCRQTCCRSDPRQHAPAPGRVGRTVPTSMAGSLGKRSSCGGMRGGCSMKLEIRRKRPACSGQRGTAPPGTVSGAAWSPEAHAGGEERAQQGCLVNAGSDQVGRRGSAGWPKHPGRNGYRGRG